MFAMKGEVVNSYVEKLKVRAESGDVDSMYRLAAHYKPYYHTNEKKPDEDIELSDYWMLKAAKNGSAKAQECIAQYHEKGVRDFKKDHKLAYKWYELSDLHFFEGEFGRDCEIAKEKLTEYYSSDSFWVKDLEARAEQGDAEAQYALGLCLAVAYGVDIKGKEFDCDGFASVEGIVTDPENAGKWLVKSARGGCKYAEWHLGDVWKYVYSISNRFERFEYAGSYCWCVSYRLAWCFYLGIGVPQSFKKARELWLLIFKAGRRYCNSEFVAKAKAEYLTFKANSDIIYDGERAAQEIRDLFEGVFSLDGKCSRMGHIWGRDIEWAIEDGKKAAKIISKRRATLTEARNGDVEAMCEVYRLSKEIRRYSLFADYDLGLEWLDKAVACGDAEAQYEMSELYYWKDRDEVVYDRDKAYELLCKSAEQNYIPALYRLHLYFDEKIDFDVEIKQVVGGN